ncbi:MAG: hypothetical protein HUK40_19485 [Desulfobacter sp.]|nr:hypothetical protein [Desulfobacter sp.]
MQLKEKKQVDWFGYLHSFSTWGNISLYNIQLCHIPNQDHLGHFFLSGLLRHRKRAGKPLFIEDKTMQIQEIQPLALCLIFLTGNLIFLFMILKKKPTIPPLILKDRNKNVYEVKRPGKIIKQKDS